MENGKIFIQYTLQDFISVNKTAISFLIIGNLIPSNIIGIVIMSLGFCLLLWARDPIMNFLKNELLNNCSKENQQKAMLNFNLSRKIVRCILATLTSLVLLKVEIIYIMIVLLIFSLVYIFFVIKLYVLLNDKCNA